MDHNITTISGENITLYEEEASEDDVELVQFFTSFVSVICALISLAAYILRKKWRKHNYLHAKQIFITCVATCWMLLLILFEVEVEDEDDYFTINDAFTVAYFGLVIMTVAGTVHTVALGHIYVALGCDEIADEDDSVAVSCYYFTASVAIVLFNVKSFLSLDIQTALCIAGVTVSAITTGNVLVLSKTFEGIERKCSLKITFLFFVISLGILSDVLLILYGALLLTGSRAGGLNDLLKMACTAVILLKTVLILCTTDAMDWKNCRSTSRDEAIEMQ